MNRLRKNILLVSIKPHSTIQKYFRGDSLKADISSYAEILDYIQGLHPDFVVYLKKQVENELQETFTFLDKNLREISKDEMYMRRPHEGDIIYIVPSIVGGGGKRGASMLILAAIAMITFPLWAPYAGLGAALTTSISGATVALGATTAISSIVSTVGLNLALMGVAMLLMPKTNTKADNSRDNDMFGSLTNTTASGTPIPLHYGLVRVAGQLVTGYTKTIENAKNEEISLSSITTV